MNRLMMPSDKTIDPNNIVKHLENISKLPSIYDPFLANFDLFDYTRDLYRINIIGIHGRYLFSFLNSLANLVSCKLHDLHYDIDATDLVYMNYLSERDPIL